jgi:TRAP-type C4-dicarboxylate transport system substrate-binding protein
MCLLLTASAGAEPVRVRIASVAPEGSAWANELRSFSRDAERDSNGEIQLKWYFGAVLGDELQTLERIRAGQVDGIASGGMACERVAPSFRIQGLPGVFQSREEVAYVTERLRPTLYAEADRNGFAMLVTTGLGPQIIFSRKPIRSFAELKKVKLWRWSVDEVGIGMSRGWD